MSRGSVGVEMMASFGPLALGFFTIWQESLLCTGQLLTQHAAASAARSAIVVLADDPKRYGGTPANAVSTERTAAVRAAAVRAMAPLVFDETVEDVDVTFPNAPAHLAPGQELTVKVTTTFRCVLPLARALLCDSSGTTKLTAEAKLPAQSARYEYARTP